jgi:hypothetical protein
VVEFACVAQCFSGARKPPINCSGQLRRLCLSTDYLKLETFIAEQTAKYLIFMAFTSRGCSTSP